jgi:hypothetical protein
MKPEEIIKAFDDVREYVFGYSLGRDNPHASDKETAKSWLESGLTLVVAVIVFSEQMNWMHEKFLRYGHAKDRSYLPASLKVFNENIEAAIRKSKGDGAFDEWEKEISKWRSRCKGWKRKKSLWRHEMWGPEPFEKGSRIPKSILMEL